MKITSKQLAWFLPVFTLAVAVINLFVGDPAIWLISLGFWILSLVAVIEYKGEMCDE